MNAILTLNAGSSSIKFAIYAGTDDPQELARGQIDNLGPDARMVFGDEKNAIDAPDHKTGVHQILQTVAPILDGRTVAGIGHRIVHGGVEFDKPQILDTAVLEKLAALKPLAPLHQPHNLAAVDAAITAFPDAVQVGCFDTGFHRGHPFVNDTFALPRRYYEKGVRRYGFHGLSYDFVSGEVARLYPDLAAGRVVIAHLGNGASMCALRAGKSVGSTMGFSALDGLPMGTRCGQLDPGVMLYLMDQEGMNADQISTMLYKESGLKGMSGISHDMRDLETSDAPEAAEAIDYFVFRIRRELGGMAAVLGGLDALVFCGGIGENARNIRARVCDGMDWLGLAVNADANDQNAQDISAGPTKVLVIPTDEERVIARAVAAQV
ncbi:acetate/propionate family kinase [Parasulfitobacter algicola]|uniref:Acetate kinase n=1 Tax=Parasulfitobacter algicola TaxID=2614809 RepID=A0ABX2IK01_9RHOB|nr:acetate/propionate family kinase [Sulfitobacter algicola]NSX53207.1 acetate/propionate family kinase [Sulfitobacter algicola]